jgi:hypothetical protein
MPREDMLGPMKEFCSVVCGYELSRQRQQRRREAAHKAQSKKRREALKTKSDWLKEAKTAFNTYIRTRDSGKPCISCGTYHPANGFRGGYWDCGHYRSTGAASHLRFNTFNTARQCKKCNQQLSGNVVEFRRGLLVRIGEDRVTRLENDNTPRKFDVDYLKRVKRIFAKRARHLKKIRGEA